VKLPLPVLSASRPISADDLFPPTKVAGLRYRVRISGQIPLLKQDRTMACSAFASAMLAGWKNGRQALMAFLALKRHERPASARLT
jgi:hypothetical protein